MNHRGYYAIIPASVRYSDDLSAHAKLLFGEITALTNEKGYCWASNAYFADLYKVHPGTISRWVSSLVDAGFIRTEIDESEGNQRRIFVNFEEGGLNKKVKTLLTKTLRPSTQKDEDPLRKNVKHNNTFNNTVNIPLSGRSGIPRNYTPLSPSADLEKNVWLDAVAVAVGAKDRHGLPKPRKWELVCMAAIQQHLDLGKFLAVIEAEKQRTKGQEEFFSPDTCLQKLQLNGGGIKSKWMHEV